LLCLTFDGWSNSSLRGFYICPAHWADTRLQRPADATPRLHQVVLDFFTVPNGPGAGSRCGSYLHALVRGYNLIDKLVAVVSDGGSDALVAAAIVKDAANTTAVLTIPASTTIVCFAHTFQLSIKPVTALVESATTKLRACISYLRSGKARRATFRTLANIHHGKATDVPCLDTPTRWNSTHVMAKQCINMRETITATALGLEHCQDLVLTKN